MTSQIDKMKNDFLRSQIFSMTMMATGQRGNLYCKDASEENKEKFRRKLREKLEEFALKYRDPIDDELHCAHIESLSSDISEACKETLTDKRFRIGSAQKALNLYLKYLWCLGILRNPPPHCPFDRIILQDILKFSDEKWTQVDDIAKYKVWVEKAKDQAKKKKMTIAEWELELYNKALMRQDDTGE